MFVAPSLEPVLSSRQFVWGKLLVSIIPFYTLVILSQINQ
jgi:hypothetical protein